MESQIFNQIEAYLSGEMNETEATAFDKEVATNKELAAAVDRHLLAHDAIEVMIEDNLRAEMKDWSAAANKNKEANIHQIGQKKGSSGKVRRLVYRLAAAASVALVVGFFGLQFSNTNYSNTALSTGAYNFDLSATRSTNTAQNPLAKGLKAYENADYAAAIQFFQNIPTANLQYNEAQYYLGHSLYQNKDYGQSINTFQKVVSTNDLRYKEAAEWYQVVNYVAVKKEGNDLTTLLNQLVRDEGHPYHKNAVELDTKLNSFWRKLQD